MNENNAFKRERKQQHETQEIDTKKLIGKYKQIYGIEFHSQVVIILETIQEQHDLQMKEQAEFHQKQIDYLTTTNNIINDNFKSIIEQNQKANQDNLASIGKATSEINKNKKTIQTNNPTVAAVDNISKLGMWLLMIVTIGFMLFFGLKQIQKIETFYTYQERSPEFIKYRNFAIQGKIIPNPTKELKGLYVELRKPKKGEALQYGLHYYYDAANERILVPLGLDEKGKNLNE